MKNKNVAIVGATGAVGREFVGCNHALRIFETGDPNLLLIKERKGPLHEDYAIERDEGLVADLKLFAATP